MPKACYVLFIGIGIIVFFKYIHDVYIKRIENFELSIFPSTAEECMCPDGYKASPQTSITYPTLNIYRIDVGFKGLGIFLCGYPGEQTLYTVHNDMGGDPSSCCYYIETALLAKMNENNVIKGLPKIATSPANCSDVQDPATCSSIITKSPESYVKLFEHSNSIYSQVGFLANSYYNYVSDELAKKGFNWVQDILKPDLNSPFFKKNTGTTSKSVLICKNIANSSITVGCQTTS